MIWMTTIKGQSPTSGRCSPTGGAKWLTRRTTRHRKGAFALEAVLTVPICLTILAFLLSTLLMVQSEIRLKAAADKTASELSLILPVVFSLLDEEDLTIPIASLFTKSSDKQGDADTAPSAGVLSGVFGFIRPEELETIINDAALDLSSSVALGRFVTTRIQYWLDRTGNHQNVGRLSVFLDWNLSKDQLFLEIYYSVQTLAGLVERRATAFVPVWRPAGDPRKSQSGPSVWSMDNFARGSALRKQFGGNLPTNYPVIARFSEGEALSIKSIDLTKPTYSDPAALHNNVTAQIEALAQFSGTAKPFGKDKVWITSTQITSRRLLLIVPSDSDLRRFGSELADLTSAASQQGVVFELVTYQKSKL